MGDIHPHAGGEPDHANLDASKAHHPRPDDHAGNHVHETHHDDGDQKELAEKLRADAWHPGQRQLPMEKVGPELPTYHFSSGHVDGRMGDTQRPGQEQKDFGALKELLATSGGLSQPPEGTPTLGYGYTVQQDNSGNLYIKQVTDVVYPQVPGQPVNNGTLVTGAARKELLGLIDKAGGLKDLNVTSPNGTRASIDVYIASDGQLAVSRAVGNENKVGETIRTVQVSPSGQGTETKSGFGPEGTFPTRSYPIELGDVRNHPHEGDVSFDSVKELQSIASSRPSTIPVVLQSNGKGGYVVDGVTSVTSIGDVNYPTINISGRQAAELRQILKAVDPNGANNQYTVSAIPNSGDVRVQTNMPLVEGQSQLITAIVAPSGKITVTESAPTVISPPVSDPGPPNVAPGTAVGDGNVVPGQSKSSSDSVGVDFGIAGTAAGATGMAILKFPFPLKEE